MTNKHIKKLITDEMNILVEKSYDKKFTKEIALLFMIPVWVMSFILPSSMGVLPALFTSIIIISMSWVFSRLILAELFSFFYFRFKGRSSVYNFFKGSIFSFSRHLAILEIDKKYNLEKLINDISENKPLSPHTKDFIKENLPSLNNISFIETDVLLKKRISEKYIDKL